MIDSEYLFDEYEKTNFIGYLWFFSSLLRIKNDAISNSNTQILGEYLHNNPDYKKAIDCTLEQFIDKIKKIEAGGVSKHEIFKNKYYDSVNFECLEDKKPLFEIKQKFKAPNNQNSITYFSSKKGAERFVVIPDRKKIAFIEHSEISPMQFDKCFLVSYSLYKDKLLFYPYEENLHGIIEHFDITKHTHSISRIIYNGNGTLFYYNPDTDIWGLY